MKRNFKGLRRGKQISEDLLLDTAKKGVSPKHVAIIMDGNGRWAAKRGLPRLAGHRASMASIREAVEIAPILGVEYLTLYTFSAENWKRPEAEVRGLMSLFEEMLKKEISDLDKKSVQLKVIGRLDELPDSTRKTFEEGVIKTAGNGGLKLIIALNYGGRGEIVDAVNKIISDDHSKREITEEDISNNLYLSELPDPDLVVRTSGESRVSNFLLWQIAYSEFWVTDVLWPDFRKINFIESVIAFQRRKRRFGGA